MKKSALISSLIFMVNISYSQVYVLQNNLYKSLSFGYSASYALGELGSLRRNFLQDFMKVQEDKNRVTKTTFLPRHSFGINAKYGIKFNPHIYLAFDLNYARLGHKERQTYPEVNTDSQYDFSLNMDYIGAGGKIVLFHPNNFQLNMGYRTGYNTWDRVRIKTKNGDDGELDWFLFNEYFKIQRRAFLGTFTFGAGYIYRSVGIDLNCSFTKNGFLTSQRDIKLINSTIAFTYYFVKKRDNNYIEQKEEDEK